MSTSTAASLSPSEDAILREAITKESRGTVQVLSVLSVLRPAFVATGCSLLDVQLRHNDAQPHRRWVLLSPEIRDAEPLSLEGASSYLRIDSQCVVGFLRMCWAIDPKRGLLAESSADVEWYTPLLEGERDALDRLLREHALKVVDEDEFAFEVEGAVLLGHELLLRRWRVHHRDSDASLGRVGRKMGSVVMLPAPSETALLSGLPTNYRSVRRVSPVAQPSSSPEAVSKEEAALILADVARRLVPIFDSDKATLRRQSLACFPMDLLEIEVIGPRETKVYKLLWCPGFAIPFDRTGGSVQAMLRRLQDTTGWKLRNGDEVLAYLEWFYDISPVRNDGSHLRLVLSSDDSWFDEVEPESIRFLVEGVTLDSLRQELKATTVEKLPNGDFVCRNLFGFLDDCLARCDLELRADGRLGGVTNEVDILRCKQKGGKVSAPRPNSALARLHPLAETEVARDDIGTDRVSPRPIQGSALAGELDRLAQDGTVAQIEISDRVVLGTTRLDGHTLRKRVVFRNCRFRGPVDLSHLASDAALKIERCVFEGGLNLANAHFEGDLALNWVISSSNLELSGAKVRSLRIRDCSVAGKLQASQLRSDGPIELYGVQVTGQVDLSAVDAGGGVSFMCLDDYSIAEVGGEMSLYGIRAESLWIGAATIGGMLELQNATVRQYIALGYETRRLFVGRRGASSKGTEPAPGISLYGVNVAGTYVSLGNVEVEGDVNATFLKVGTGFFLESEKGVEPAYIGGNVSLHWLRAADVVRIRRCEVRGNIGAHGLKTGELRIAGGYSDEGRRPTAQSDKRQKVQQQPVISHPPVRIGGRVNLSDATIDGDACLAGVVTGDANEGDGNADEKERLASLDLSGARVGGDVILYLTKEKAESTLDRKDPVKPGLVSRFPDGLILRNATIRGDLEMSHVDVESGRININDAEIGRDVCLVVRDKAETAARARELDMEGLRCQGGVFLTHLALSAPGNVLGKNASVAKQIQITNGSESAVIPGRLDLSFATVGAVEVSPKPSFSGESHRESNAIIFNRATIDKMRIHVEADVYPHPIDLRYADVRWWEFIRNGESASDQPLDYIRLLRGDLYTQLHTWRSLESTLRNQAHEHAADEIHVAMRRWQRATTNAGLRKARLRRRISARIGLFGSWVFDVATRSQTSPLRLLALVVAWLAVSTYFFSLPANLGPTEEARSVTSEAPSAAAIPDRKEWSLGSGFWIALRYHVPIALFTALEDWEPRDDSELRVREASDGRYWCVPLASPEGYANTVLMCHWLFWPAIIVIGTRKFFRRAES